MLQELLDEAEKVKKAGFEGEVLCEVECECRSMMAMDSLLMRKASARPISKSGSYDIPDVRCRCGARQAYERRCKKNAELKHRLQNDPASAFALDDEELLKYIRQEVFGEPKENYRPSESKNFFSWFSTYVLEVNEGANKGNAFDADYTTGTRKKWTGLSFLKNLRDIAENFRSSKDCCNILRPGKLVAECLLNARTKGCFVQCCAKGQQIFEKVYCDEKTGSLAFICRFFTDFLLSARNVPMAGNVSGKVLCGNATSSTNKVTTLNYFDPEKTNNRKQGMKVSEMDLMNESVEISDYWKTLFNALIEETYDQIFLKHKGIKTYQQELEYNSNNRLRAVCARLVAANGEVNDEQHNHLLMRPGDFRITRMLKEHRMIGGSNPGTKPTLDALGAVLANENKWDPTRSETEASEANTLFFSSNPESETFWFQLEKNASLKPAIKNSYTNLNPANDTELSNEANRKLLEMSVLRMALEGFKETFDLNQLDDKKNKTKTNMTNIHKYITQSKSIRNPASKASKAGFNTCFYLGAKTETEDHNLFFDTSSKRDEDKIKADRIVFNRTFDKSLVMAKGADGTGDDTAVYAEAQSFKLESGKKIADVLDKVAVRCVALWKSHRLPNVLTSTPDAPKLLNSNSVSVTISGSSVHDDSYPPAAPAGTKEDAETGVDAPKDAADVDSADGQTDLAGSSYYTEKEFKPVSDKSKPTDFGVFRSRDTYNYFAKILCNKITTLKCDDFGYVAPLSSVEKERHEHNSKLMSEMIDCLYTIHGPKQHWGLICNALEKVLISIGC